MWCYSCSWHVRGDLTLNSMAQIHTSVTLLRHVISRGALVRSRASTPHTFLLSHTFREARPTCQSALIALYDCVYRAKGWGMRLAWVTAMSRSDYVGTVYAAFGIHQSDNCLCLIRIQATKLPQAGFEDTFSWNSCEEVGRESLTIIKRCILLMQFLTVPDTNNLIVNIKFMKIKVTVRINLKRPNLNYPSCHNVSCDRHALYSLAGVLVFPTLRFGRL
jgi:hypothetical protein